MAKTRLVREAVNLAMKSLPRLDDSSFAADTADMALSLMWRWYPWDESLVDLPPIYMTPDEPDVEAPARVVPGDFWFLERAWLRDVPDGMTWPLTIHSRLNVAGFGARPQGISYEASRNSFRFHPTPTTGEAAPRTQVEGVYKKTPTKITQANIVSEVLPFDDQYFEVYLEALKYQTKNLLGSPDAGEVQINNAGQATYTGQFGRFVNSLTSAVRHENRRADARVAPREGIMLG